METQEQALLCALRSAVALAHGAALEAEQVNDLGASEGLSAEEVCRLVERLQTQLLVEIHWGGRVSLTAEGHARATGRTSVPQVQLGEGATYIGEGARVTGVVGQNAMGHASVRMERPVQAIGELAAGLQALRSSQHELPAVERAATQALAKAVDATLEETRRTKPEKTALETHLQRTTRALDNVGKLVQAAERLGPALALIRSAVGALGRWLTGI